ncbi:metallophosphoesterase, partial [Klebsiella pneumoniae]|uniref:metallophosphoesterase n=1 Tax=Klebsiella pneumoniae TaxID=573 RepID=UPI003FD25602
MDRSVTPWLIFAGHRPWYSTGGGDNVCGPCQDAFEGTLYKYGVDVAVFGHVHNSQVSNLIATASCSTKTKPFVRSSPPIALHTHVQQHSRPSRLQQSKSTPLRSLRRNRKHRRTHKSRLESHDQS